MFFHLIDIFMLNSFQCYRKRNGPPMKNLDFRMEVIDQYRSMYKYDEGVLKALSRDPKSLLKLHHFPWKTIMRPNGIRQKLGCVYCKRFYDPKTNKRIRSTTRYI